MIGWQASTSQYASYYLSGDSNSNDVACTNSDYSSFFESSYNTLVFRLDDSKPFPPSIPPIPSLPFPLPSPPHFYDVKIIIIHMQTPRAAPSNSHATMADVYPTAINAMETTIAMITVMKTDAVSHFLYSRLCYNFTCSFLCRKCDSYLMS